MTISAQELLPLTENDVLQRFHLQRESQLPEALRYNEAVAREKNHCNPQQIGIRYVEAGRTLTLDFNLLNPSIDDNGVLTCSTCNELTSGTAQLETDSTQTIDYVANTGVTIGTDQLTILFCSSDLSTCYDSITFDIQVQRAGKNFYPAPIQLLPGEMTQVDADISEFPGALFCTSIIDCTDEYEGREQRVYLTDYSNPTNSFIYRSSRFAGVDSICLELCDEFAICDTFHYAFEIAKQRISIPFLDDFSYDGPYPDLNLWLDNEVFVNKTMAIDPPSIGVATFDGLNGNGKAYSNSDGQSDRLTSNYIDLNGVSGPLALSFYLEPKGLMDKPEVKDSLILEFRKSNGKWTNIYRFVDTLPNTRERFSFYSFEVTPDFRHQDFQFRLYNYSDRSGIQDNWHLDYVRLSQENPDSIFGDIAFTKLPDFILSPLTSMPYRHFEGAEAENLSNQLSVGLYNHTDQALNISPTSVELIELNTNITPFGPSLTLLNGQEANVPNGVPVNRVYDLQSFPTTADPIYGDYFQIMSGPGLDGFEQLAFLMTYNLENGSQIDQPGFEAVQRNDQVERTTVMKDYFAYDDGTAESKIVTGQGNRIAVQFTTQVPDTLRAVQFHIPHFDPLAEDQEFLLQIYLGELDDEPEYEYAFDQYYTDSFFDTLQGFTTYPLVDRDGNLAPLALPAGNFYVGWQQKSSCDFVYCFAVGYDLNRPQGKELISREYGLGWEPLAEFTRPGALMLRPVVGSKTPGATDVKEEPQPLDFLVYPNPARNMLNISLSDGNMLSYEYALINSLGQIVRKGALTATIEIDGLQAGMYYLKISDTRNNQSYQQRVVILEE
ncbi:MAG: hypothetical protein DHS20C18_52540 [Saprospiraceae bacterium]|nr:MAG: hypothetical protein DHS20C18_52540 [Saprospiraceae bacterium]